MYVFNLKKVVDHDGGPMTEDEETILVCMMFLSKTDTRRDSAFSIEYLQSP